MATLVSTPADSIDYTPSGATASGAVVVQGELVGVCTRPLAASEFGSLAVAGVFDFPKPAATAFATVGVLMYWDVADQNAQTTADSGTNKLIGKLVKAAGANDTTCRIRMSQ